MAIWTVFPMATTCGRCGAVMPALAPVQLLTAAKLRRCEGCATTPVPAQEIELERFRLETEAERQAMAEEQAVARTPPPVRRDSAPLPFRRLSSLPLPFDPKAAAAGDRE